MEQGISFMLQAFIENDIFIVDNVTLQPAIKKQQSNGAGSGNKDGNQQKQDTSQQAHGLIGLHQYRAALNPAGYKLTQAPPMQHEASALFD